MSETIEAPNRLQVPRAHIKGLIASLGFDPNEVTEIFLSSDEVRVTCIDKHSWPPAFTIHMIPIVG